MSIPKTAFKKGEKRPGQGRPKGATNKVTKELKEMILEALANVGGVGYLEERANDPKTAAAFMSLVGRVLPMTVSGDPENPIQFQVIERRIVKASGH